MRQQVMILEIEALPDLAAVQLILEASTAVHENQSDAVSLVRGCSTICDVRSSFLPGSLCMKRRLQ